jgi:Fic family protein
MQELWNRARPQVLKKLRESAIVQSAESSNRIEGVEVDKERLLPLVLGGARPRDRSEEEIAGYRKALNFIHKKFDKIEISPDTILTIHEYAQGGMISDAGKWKTKDNDIIEISPQGNRRVRFKPVPAAQTSKAMEQLCLGYADINRNSKLPELICVSSFIFDFLCIHPFRDGNGRVSRLLTLLLLYQHDFEVGKYISLERLIENSKEDYYRVLGESSIGWQNGKHDLLPWWNYFLTILKSAYQELKERVELTLEGDSQSAIIRQVALSQKTPFGVSEIQNLVPAMGRELIKKVLFKLRDEKEIVLTGKGRGAKWEVIRKILP